MRQLIGIAVLSSLLSACTTSPPIGKPLFDYVSGKSELLDAIYADCMTVNVMRFKEEEKAPNPTASANYYCQNYVVGACRDLPGTDTCKKWVRSYDLKRGQSGPSVLFDASRRGNARLVRQLQESGFSPNAPLGGPGWTGWTPLMIATAENHEETVRLLLDAGADPNAQNDLGRTPLMFASNYGNASVVAMLLDKGVNPNVIPRDETGWTALMAAASKGHARVVQLLLDRGADKSLQDKKGLTALALAELNKQSETVRILRSAGNTK